MPKTNYTIDNINPAILYSPPGSWTNGGVIDTERDRYSDSTFKSTTTVNATATFTFSGTSVWVYGAKRMNHGKYSVNLDGKLVDTFDGQGPGQFQVPLYSAISLSLGSHTVSLTNVPTSKDNNYLDIDFITYETDIGTPEETLEISVVQDTDSQFTYSPPTSWSTTSDKLQDFNESTGHLTDQNAGLVTCDFTGDAISIWGSMGPDNGPYSISLDGGEAKSFNASGAKYLSQVRLYEANNLGPGEHFVVMMNQPQVSGQVMAIDYAVITNIAATKGTAQQPQKSPGLPSGTKAGIAVGAAAGAIVIIGLLWLLLIRKRKTKTQPHTQTRALDKYGPVSSTVSPPLAPVQTSNITPYPWDSTVRPTSSKAMRLAQSSPTSQDSLLAESRPHMPLAAILDAARDNHHQPMSDAAIRLPTPSGKSSNTLWISESTASDMATTPSSVSETTSIPRRPPQTPSRPEAGSQGLEGRIREPGREIDVGPLPPSYVQATQPI